MYKVSERNSVLMKNRKYATVGEAQTSPEYVAFSSGRKNKKNKKFSETHNLSTMTTWDSTEKSSFV